MLNYHELRKRFRTVRQNHILPMKTVILGVIFLILAVCVASSYVCASEGIRNEDAIKAIIGEAESQGYEGMLAVACAIRNRGTLKGVYGENASRVKKHLYNQETYRLAQKAWNKSGPNYKTCNPSIDCNIDITHGATHWENIIAFGKPYWADSCTETIRIKDHQFYKCKG